MIPIERAPGLSNWYNTDKGRLYWFDNRSVWSCREDRVYEEFPTVWYEKQLTGWLPPKSAPKSGHFIGLTDKDEIFKIHFAQDLSGEEQPPFSGFYRSEVSCNYEVTLKGWMALPK